MAKPEVVSITPDIILYHGDCLDILPIEHGAIVTDPPYGQGYKTKWGASWKCAPIAGDGDTTSRDRALDGAPNVAAFGTWKTGPIADVRGVLVWDKGPGSGMGDLSFPWKQSYELIYIRGKIWKGRRDEGVLRGQTCSSNNENAGRTHPAEKPPGIIEKLLYKLPRGTVVLDPFMGTGSAGVACARHGFPFIGIEIERKYFDVACRRIDNEARQGRLFA